MLLPSKAEQIVAYRFPDYLDSEVVRHSDESFTITLMDLDYKHYTFRLNRSWDGRWTLAPIAGFEDTDSLGLGVGWLRGGST